MARRYIAVGETITLEFKALAYDAAFRDRPATNPVPGVRWTPDNYLDFVGPAIETFAYDPWSLYIIGIAPGLVTIQIYANTITDVDDNITALIESEIFELEVRPVPESDADASKLIIKEVGV